MDFIDASKFGVKPSATGVQNQNAMAAAISAADAAGIKEIHLPPGVLKFNMHNLRFQVGSIVLNGNYIIRGAGRDRTTLKADGFVEGSYHVDGGGNYIVDVPHDNGHAMLYIPKADGHSVLVTDMTVEGPDVSEITMDLNVCWGYWCGGGGFLRFERVEFNRWNQCGKCSPEYPTYPGVGTRYSAEDCILGARASGGPLHISGTDGEKDSADFVRCTFYNYDYGTPVQAGIGTSNGENPCFYINTGVALSCTDCHFKAANLATGATAAAVGWLHYGGSYFMGQNNTPKYARCTNCLFDVDIPLQMYTNSYGPTTVVGCTFKTGFGNACIETPGDLTITGCQFLPVGGGYGISEVVGHDVEILVSNCTFGILGGDGYGIAAYRTTAGTKEWSFVNCTFNDAHSAGNQAQMSADGRLRFDNCVFQGTGGVNAIYGGAGLIVVNDCVFKGLPIYADAFFGDVTLELNRNRWDVANPIQIQAPTHNVTLRGGDNRLYENTAGIGEGIFIVGSTGVANISGSLMLPRSVGAYTYASGVLSVNLNHDAYEINEGGWPTINTITMTGLSAAGVEAADHNRYHNGRIYLRVKQAFTLGSSDNIVAAGGVREVGSLIALQWFPGTNKWVEISGATGSWHLIGGGGEPAFQNSWVNFGSGYQSLRFKKDAFGVVRIEGVIKSGTSGTVVFTLPAGYRPANDTFAPGILGNLSNASYVEVDTNGDVLITVGGGGAVASMGVYVSFSIE